MTRTVARRDTRMTPLTLCRPTPDAATTLRRDGENRPIGFARHLSGTQTAGPAIADGASDNPARPPGEWLRPVAPSWCDRGRCRCDGGRSGPVSGPATTGPG